MSKKSTEGTLVAQSISWNVRKSQYWVWPTCVFM